MSVPTKALTLAILIGFISGCAAVQDGAVTGDETNTTQISESTITESSTEVAADINQSEANATAEQVASDTTAEAINETTQEAAAIDVTHTSSESAPVEISATLETTTPTETSLSAPTEHEMSSASKEISLQTSSEGSSERLADPSIQVKGVSLSRGEYSNGEVRVEMNTEAAFILEQTAMNEYVLRIPGAQIDESAKSSQIAPAGQSGIRSIRVGDNSKELELRMFIDKGVTLKAIPEGSTLRVLAMSPAQDTLSRGQLATPADGKKKESTEDAAQSAPTGLRSSDGSKIYTGRLISLDLQETEIDNALRIIAEVSQLNIIASEDVKGKVTLRLIDVPWDQALDVILKTNGLDQVQEGNVIRIAPVSKLREEREALLEAKQAAEALEDLQVRYIRVSYARAADIQEQVQSVLSERGNVAIDERTNQLIIKDIAKGQEAAEELLRKLDLRTPQILIETQIVEASKSLARTLGFNWTYLNNIGPNWGNSTGLVFPNSITSNVSVLPQFTPTADSVTTIGAVLDSADGARKLSATLSALEQENVVKILSRPQIATLNNKEAKISSVEIMRIKLPDSGTSIATGQGAAASGGNDTATEEIPVGIELTITPQASPDYYVLMDVFAKSSSFSSRDPESNPDNIPNTIEREATSTVLVKSGQTFALGGVYRIEDSEIVDGVPFLKDIPFLGHAFRQNKLLKGDVELIFFLTPHIVEGSFEKGSM